MAAPAVTPTINGFFIATYSTENPRRKRFDIELGIDTIDPGSYTVADGDGQTTTARDAGIDVGGNPRLWLQETRPYPIEIRPWLTLSA